jgi:hypothetical protein
MSHATAVGGKTTWQPHWVKAASRIILPNTGKPGYKGTGYKGTGYKGTGYKGTGYKGNLFIRVVNREPNFFFLPKLVWL